MERNKEIPEGYFVIQPKIFKRLKTNIRIKDDNQDVTKLIINICINDNI